MQIEICSSAWFAAVVPSDPNHTHAANWLATNSDFLITTDYIIDETLTLLRARGERQRAKLFGEKFFDESIAEVYFLTEEDIRQYDHGPIAYSEHKSPSSA